jgi:hypothetical protein
MTWKRSEIQTARQTPLKPLLERLGYQLSPTGQENYVVVGMPAEVVIKQHYWVCKDDGSAGNSIDFLMKLLGKSFNEAMELLTS